MFILESEGLLKSVVDQYPLKSLNTIWPVYNYSTFDEAEIVFFDVLMFISINS